MNTECCKDSVLNGLGQRRYLTHISFMDTLILKLLPRPWGLVVFVQGA